MQRILRLLLPKIILGIFVLLVIWWVSNLQTENEWLEEELDRQLKYSEELESNLTLLNENYSNRLKELETNALDKELITKELSKVKDEVRKKSEKDSSVILIDTSEYILNRLREQETSRDS